MRAKYRACNDQNEEMQSMQHVKSSLQQGVRRKFSCCAQIERQRQEEAERAGKAAEECEEARAALKQAEKELKQIDAEQTKLQGRLRESALSMDKALARRTQLELDVTELEEKREAGASVEASD